MEKNKGNDNVVRGPGGDKITPADVIEDITSSKKKLTTLIVLCEWDDGTSSMAYSSMSPRDLWWQLTNACMRVWNMIGGG